MAKEKQSDFVVSDKRKFTAEGELRPDAPPSPEEAAPEPVAPPAPPPAPTPAPIPASTATAPADEEAPLPPPTEAAAGEAQQSYRDSGKKIDERIAAAGHSAGFEVTFEHLLSSLYMTALMQLGMMHPEGAQPRLDLMGARSTIDTLALLEQKTRGNLTEAENKMLQQSLYELHVAFVEVTNALTHPPDAPPPGPPRGAK
jgi:hypothetical protein